MAPFSPNPWFVSGPIDMIAIISRIPADRETFLGEVIIFQRVVTIHRLRIRINPADGQTRRDCSAAPQDKDIPLKLSDFESVNCCPNASIVIPFCIGSPPDNAAMTSASKLSQVIDLCVIMSG